MHSILQTLEASATTPNITTEIFGFISNALTPDGDPAKIRFGAIFRGGGRGGGIKLF